jgi:adenylate cyclase
MEQSGAPDDAETRAVWRIRIAAARHRGDHLAAYDLAVQALAADPVADEFEYAAILALARCGVTELARARYDRFTASGRISAIADANLATDFAALNGRLWKDLAARRDPDAAGHCWHEAASAYAKAYHDFGGYFPAINAATCYLASAHSVEAAQYARTALGLAEQAEPEYWAVATQIEALLILGQREAAVARVAHLPRQALTNLDEVATTRRQIDLVVRLTGIDFDVRRYLPAPRVVYWRPDQGDCAPDAALPFAADEKVIAFVPLLSGDDLAMATRLLAADVDVTAVLPCAPENWLASRPAEPELAETLTAILAGASGLIHVTVEGGVDEPAARELCGWQAHGLARLRAQGLATVAEVLCSTGEGLAVLPAVTESRAASTAVFNPARRYSRSILFGDVHGFSRLSEAGQLTFLTCVIGGFAEVLDRFDTVEYAETAGDGLFVVVSDVVSATECCFALRDVLLPQRIAAAGLPAHLGLRLSAHVGPLYRRYDPVIRREKFCGMEVIRTARIEPVTPVGEIFVTQQFAATLASEAGGDYVCEYAGQQKMAKDFGECRMYSLRRAIS